MGVLVKIGPADHGRPISLEEFEKGDYEQGYKYELIDGKLYVVPAPDTPEGFNEEWICRKIRAYSLIRPDVINWAFNKTRVFVPGRPDATIPEPDVAAYHDFPVHLPLRQINWRNLSPILVAEVLSGDPEKDLVRNVELYLEVPSIKEYWVIDTREDPDHPTMRVYRRSGKRWRIIDLAFGETYTTRLLPGFELVVDPRR